MKQADQPAVTTRILAGLLACLALVAGMAASPEACAGTTPQTITFTPLPTRLITDPPFTVTATASSGLAVSFFTTTLPVCTVSGATVSIVSPGTCTIVASQLGNGTYAAAPNVAQSFQVTLIPTTTTATASVATSFHFEPVSVTAAVTSANGTPGGTVTLLDGTTAIATATLDGAGRATILTTALNVGNRSLAIRYEGTATFAVSTSAAIPVNVQCSPYLSGRLDPAFGCEGEALAPANVNAGRPLVQPDGRIVLFRGADLAPFATTATLSRLLPTGAVDTTFATGGVLSLPFTNAALDAAGISASGRIVVASPGLNDVSNPAPMQPGTLYAFDGTGAPDATFGIAGVVALPIQVNSLEVRPDGTVIAGGSTRSGSQSVAAIVRVLPNGALDTTIGTGGVVTLPGTVVVSLAAQGDGKILVIGSQLVRFNADGTPDTAFGTAVASLSGAFRFASIVRVGSDAKIYVGGWSSTDAPDGTARYVIARLLPSGAADPGFGAAGLSTGNVSGAGNTGVVAVNSLATDPTGNVHFTWVYICVCVASFRVESYARLDAGGVARESFQTRTMLLFSDTPGSVALQADGKVVLSPTFLPTSKFSVFSVLRLRAAGSQGLGFFQNAFLARTTVSRPIPYVDPAGAGAPAAITVSGGEYSIGCTTAFTSAPGSIASGQSVCVRHVTAASPATLTRTTLTIGGAQEAFSTLTAQSSAAALVASYYRTILGRDADAAGQAFWESEAARTTALGANVTEAFFAMSGTFFASPEYAARKRDTAGFVSDLYVTFFDRAPDAFGLAFWTGQIAAGMPREVALASFMFSPEFASYMQGLFGNTSARAEVDVTMDFYRGLLARLPDTAGFNFWVQRFRTAQCQGAAAVVSQADAISSQFAGSAEYLARNRFVDQYVGDLYNAFLRRGGDLTGVQFWITQISSGALTRDQARKAFVASPEFGARVNAVIAQGCLP